MLWVVMAGLSAFFSGLSSVIAKWATKEADPDVATAIKGCAVFLCAWLMACFTGSVQSISEVSAKSMALLIASGMTNGLTWVFLYRALVCSTVNKIMAVEKIGVILTVLFGMVFFGELQHLLWKLIGIAILFAGVFVLFEKNEWKENFFHGSWLKNALLAAVCAAVCSIFSKIGIDNVDSNLGTAINTTATLVLTWIVVFMEGKQKTIKILDRKEAALIFLSGTCTGICWLCYYYALQQGLFSVVVPINKLNIVVGNVLSVLFLGETITKRKSISLLLLVIGTIWIAILS